MSYWLFGKKRDGRRSLYSASVPVTLILIMAALLFSIILSLLAWPW
ncbi:MAG: hypothetical protein ABIP48_30515 [Planctomycetota bacterium]